MRNEFSGIQFDGTKKPLPKSVLVYLILTYFLPYIIFALFTIVTRGFTRVECMDTLNTPIFFVYIIASLFCSTGTYFFLNKKINEFDGSEEATKK